MVRSRFAWLKSTKIRVAAFLLPPRRGDLFGHAPLQFAGRRDHGVPDVKELPGGLDRGVDMQPAVPGGLDERLQPGLGKHGAQFLGGRDGVPEIRFRAAGQGRSGAGPGCPGCRPWTPRDGTRRCSSARPRPRPRPRRGRSAGASVRWDTSPSPSGRSPARPWADSSRRTGPRRYCPPNRWSVTGRSPFAARNASPTSTMYRARSSLVRPSSGQRTLDGTRHPHVARAVRAVDGERGFFPGHGDKLPRPCRKWIAGHLAGHGYGRATKMARARIH